MPKKRWRKALAYAEKAAPVVAFFLFLGWYWRIYDLTATIPAYGDILEMMWGMNWYKTRLLTLSDSPFFAASVFYPEGWHLLTSANGVGAFLLLLPLTLVANEAFAYNFLALFMTAVTFSGMVFLARQYTANRLTITLAALLFTFWAPRWLRLRGHMTIFIGTGLLPWLVYCLEKAVASPRHRRRWLIMVGVIWAFTMSLSLYFIWLSGLVLGCWLLACFINGRLTGKEALKSLLLPTITMVGLSLLFIVPFWRARNLAEAVPFSFNEINSWSLNVNSVLSPLINHTWPWVRQFARQFYTGPIDETSTINLGILVFIILVFSLIYQVRHRIKQWLPMTLLTICGLLLALGPTLHWNDALVPVYGFQPLNDALWKMGFSLKPAIFLTEQMPEQLAQAIPLPGFVLTAVVPFYESARVSARFALAAGLGVFLLVPLTLEKIRWHWLRLLIIGLLLLGFLPVPLQGVPFPPAAHPAYIWLQEQPAANPGAVLELYAYEPQKWIMPVGGETVWAAQIHEKPIVSGASSIWPHDYHSLRNWFFGHQQPLLDREISSILQAYEVGYLLLQIRKPADMGIVETVQAQKEWEFIGCFDPVADGRAWHYPICIFSP